MNSFIFAQNLEIVIKQIKMNMFRYFFLLLLFSNQYLLAQKENTEEMTNKEHELKEIVVTGTGTPNQRNNTPVKTDLITQKTISQVSSGRFDELISTISPSFDYSPGSMGSFIQLNGLGNKYILILIDGKRMYGDVGGQSDLNRISVNTIERIEVVKGASSSLYGSEAIAGVINLITKKSNKGLFVENDSRFGTIGSWQQYNAVTFNKGAFYSKTSFSRKQSIGWQLNKYELDDQRNDDPSDDELVRVYDNVSNEFFDNQVNQELAFDISKKIMIRGAATLYRKSALLPTEARAYGFDYEDISYNLGTRYQFNDSNFVELDYHSDNFKYYYLYTREYEVKVADGESTQTITYNNGDRPLQTDQKRQTAHLKGVFSLPFNQRLSIGAEYINEIMEAPSRLLGNKQNVYTGALYLQDETRFLSTFFVTVGLRYSLHKEFRDKLSPKISAMYKVGGFSAAASYAAGFKAPTLKELYYRYEKVGRGSNYLYLGDPSIKPQNSDYFSGSIDYDAKVFSISLSAYNNKVNDLIAYKTIETSPEDAARGISVTKVNSNINEAQIQGVEFTFSLRPFTSFIISSSYSYTDAKNIAEDMPLEGVSENSVTVNAGWQKHFKKYELGLHLFGRIQSERYYEDGNAPAYSNWKLTSTHGFILPKSFNLNLTLGVDNILNYVDDRPFGSNYSTISPGRTYFIGINLHFSK